MRITLLLLLLIPLFFPSPSRADPYTVIELRCNCPNLTDLHWALPSVAVGDWRCGIEEEGLYRCLHRSGDEARVIGVLPFSPIGGGCPDGSNPVMIGHTSFGNPLFGCPDGSVWWEGERLMREGD